MRSAVRTYCVHSPAVAAGDDEIGWQALTYCCVRLPVARSDDVSILVVVLLIVLRVVVVVLRRWSLCCP